MSRTSTPATARFLYVEIPPSPLHSSSSRLKPMKSLPSRLSLSSVNLKENTPSRRSITTHVSSQGIKRKDEELYSAQQPSKKPRLADPAAPSGSGSMVPEATSVDINCHQCKRKYDPSSIVQCTFHALRNTSRRCTAKYCRNCIKKYNEDYDRIVTHTRGQKENGHVEANYVFKCFKCRGQCTCWRCRKLANTSDPSAANQSNKTIPPNSNKVQAKAAPTQSIPSSSLTGGENTIKPPVKVKPLPNVNWIELPSQIALPDAEDRIVIREFFLRFSNLRGMSIPKAQLQELEHIGGMGDVDEGLDSEEDSLPDWTSEACVRSMILGLLGVLAAEEDSSATLAMKNATKDIKNSGVNLTKIWAVLATLRASLGPPDKVSEASGDSDDDDESSEDRIILDYPDPLPAPAQHHARSTRSVATDAFLVVHTAQMIPVILGLIETVLESHAIRTELEEGAKEGREKYRESRECVKSENDSWDQMRKGLEEAQEPDVPKIKTERQAHKSRVQAIESAFKVIAPSYAGRFSPLGTDYDGRTYWALTPGIHDREYALDYITSRLPTAPRSKKPRNRKHRHAKDGEDRKAFKEWSWFLAVWGTKPADEVANAGQAADESWFGFYDPAEIRKLAEWISMKNGLRAHDSSRPQQPSEAMNALVKSITDYATVLEWRVQGEED